MRILFILLSIIIISCSTIKYKSTTQKKLPELGTVGIYKNYILESDHQPKTIVSLSKPVLLKVEKIQFSDRLIFKQSDSISIKKDSTLVTFEILDKLSLIRQINEDDLLMKYIKIANNYRLVSKVKMHFTKEILNKINSADEIYLTQHKQSTLSLELRKNNKTIETIEFSDGEILGFEALDFCWGQNRRRDIELFDLVRLGANCSEDTYKSARKVKRKNEFKI